MTGLIWAFLNSPIGLALLAAGAAWLWRKLRTGDKKALRNVELMTESFQVAEQQGLLNKLPGVEKWKVFVNVWISARQAEKLGMPTAQEMEAAKQFAYRKAWLIKSNSVIK